jgi:hypothetical protein
MGELAQRQAAYYAEGHANAQRNCAKTVMPIASWNEAMAKIRKPGQPTHVRLAQLIDLATRFNDAVLPHSACRPGCSHCCYILVPLSRSEAQMIAKATKRKLTEPLNPIDLGVPRDPLPTNYDNPCTFLKGTHCTIYNDRPMACRTCVNMDDIPLLCELDPDSDSNVPYADARPIWQLAAQVLGDQTYADIRDWFPG